MLLVYDSLRAIENHESLLLYFQFMTGLVDGLKKRENYGRFEIQIERVN